MFEQDRFITRLQQKVGREAGISACFLSGSYGRRTADEYSDLDVALVFSSDQLRDEAWTRRREFVKEVLPYVPAKSFDADHVRPYFHVALYGNGSKVDYRFESRESLQPNPWDGELRILKDTAGWAADFAARSAQRYAPSPRISASEMARLDSRFWVMFWDIWRLLLRGDADKGFPVYLQLLQFTLPSLIKLLPPEEPARQALIAAGYGHEAQVNQQHMRALLQAYQAARTAVIRRTNVAFTPDNSFERAITQLLERRV